MGQYEFEDIPDEAIEVASQPELKASPNRKVTLIVIGFFVVSVVAGVGFFLRQNVWVSAERKAECTMERVQKIVANDEVSFGCSLATRGQPDLRGEAIVWIEAGLDPKDLDGTKSMLEKTFESANFDYEYVSAEQTLEEFRSYYADSDEILSLVTDPQVLPTSYKLDFEIEDSYEQLELLVDEFAKVPNIKTVSCVVPTGRESLGLNDEEFDFMDSDELDEIQMLASDALDFCR